MGSTKNGGSVSAVERRVRILLRKVRKPVSQPKSRIPPLSAHQVIAPTHTALALQLVTEMDLLRLKSLARLYARGLPPDVTWEDLLQEAITRVLTGKRPRPDDVPMVAFLSGVMRSLRSDHIRRARRGMKRSDSVWIGKEDALLSDHDVLDPSADPERALIAADELEKIRQVFADDPVALNIIEGLAEGLTAEQIRARHSISRTDYDSARKRMRRCLIRGGLTCGSV
jgi:RNA polymerase sigma-70 factor (ECF subfamily)